MSFKNEIKRYKEAVAVAKRYIQHEDVNDIFIGSKYIKGQPQKQISIRFNVDKKRSKSKLKSSRMLPKSIGKFKTDVTDFKPKKNIREVNPVSTVRPLLGGIQIQSSLFNGPSGWGTIGCAMRINGTVYGITNFHVSFGELPDGQPPNGQINILQPKFRNFGEIIGRSTSVFNQFLDYSLFELSSPADGMQSINGFDGEIEGFVRATEDMRLFKFGASTGKTFGIFDARSIINQHRIIIRYDGSGPNDSPRISAPGDSGSLWVTNQFSSPGKLRIAALHYGGDEDRNLAFASLFSSISQSIRNKIPSP
jgi:hypothetical protein